MVQLIPVFLIVWRWGIKKVYQSLAGLALPTGINGKHQLRQHGNTESNLFFSQASMPTYGLIALPIKLQRTF